MTKITDGGCSCVIIVRVVVMSIIAFNAGKRTCGACNGAPSAQTAATAWHQISVCNLLVAEDRSL
jgi:hypothetical protein